MIRPAQEGSAYGCAQSPLFAPPGPENWCLRSRERFLRRDWQMSVLSFHVSLREEVYDALDRSLWTIYYFPRTRRRLWYVPCKDENSTQTTISALSSASEWRVEAFPSKTSGWWSPYGAGYAVAGNNTGGVHRTPALLGVIIIPILVLDTSTPGSIRTKARVHRCCIPEIGTI